MTMISSRPTRRQKERIYQFPLEFAAIKRNLSDFLTACFRPPIALPAPSPLPHGPHLEADMCAWHNHRTPTFGFDIEPGGRREQK